MAASEGPLCVVTYVTSCRWAGGVLTGSERDKGRSEGNEREVIKDRREKMEEDRG